MRRDLSVLALAVAALGGCSADAPLLGSSREPFLYLVIDRGPSRVRNGGPDSVLHALVATVGSPNAGQFRSIGRFEMRRASDLALFDWTVTPRSGAVDVRDVNQASAAGWNVHLPWVGAGGRLGRRDLQAGETYLLDVESEGRVLTGTATIPGRPALVVDSVAAPYRLHWSGTAVLYALDSDTEISVRTVVDTMIALGYSREPQSVPDPAWARVTAMDASLASFLLDPGRTSSGVHGALGLFGAMAVDSVRVPRSGPATNTR